MIKDAKIATLGEEAKDIFTVFSDYIDKPQNVDIKLYKNIHQN